MFIVQGAPGASWISRFVVSVKLELLSSCYFFSYFLYPCSVLSLGDAAACESGLLKLLLACRRFP